MTRVHAEGGSKSPREAWEEIEAVFGADPLFFVGLLFFAEPVL